MSLETGTAQVFVRPFPDVQQGKWQISADGGSDPLWSGNNRELFFRSMNGRTFGTTQAQIRGVNNKPEHSI